MGGKGSGPKPRPDEVWLAYAEREGRRVARDFKTKADSIAKARFNQEDWRRAFLAAYEDEHSKYNPGG